MWMIDRSFLKIIFVMAGCWAVTAQELPVSAPASGSSAVAVAPGPDGEPTYILGPQDTILIKALNAEELGTLPYPIDLQGNIKVPMVGRIHAAGLTIEQLEAMLTEGLKEYLQDPIVTVTVAEFHSQPISVLGQVANPGVHQIQGHKTLFEVISEAGGLKPDAGNTIKITRRKEWGPIPLQGAIADSSSQFSVAEVTIRSVMEAQ